MFTKATEYAIKAMLFINLQDEKKIVNLTDIATAIESPMPFTAKILQQLKRSKLLESTAGNKGGFWILPGKKITIKDIILVTEGDGFFKNCVLGLKECSGLNPCPVHFSLTEFKKGFEEVLANVDLSKYSSDIKDRKISLK
jgi:Rrf2 family iron-sulfur cluster assembly transcriptional regulator